MFSCWIILIMFINCPAFCFKVFFFGWDFSEIHPCHPSSSCQGMGLKLQEIEKTLSIALIRADGLDQAKHRCPRSLVQGHHFQRLLRPALHIQSFGFESNIFCCCFSVGFSSALSALSWVVGRSVRMVWGQGCLFPFSIFSALLLVILVRFFWLEPYPAIPVHVKT